MQARSSSQGDEKGVWKDIWRLRILNVEKKFLWHACHEILPTCDKLFQRKITTGSAYPICGRKAETVIHILW
jgi:hypothetical protein